MFYFNLENQVYVVNLQLLCFWFGPQVVSPPFLSTEITNYKDVSIYMFYEEAYLCIIEPNIYVYILSSINRVLLVSCICHLKVLKTSFKTVTVEGLGKYS